MIFPNDAATNEKNIDFTYDALKLRYIFRKLSSKTRDISFLVIESCKIVVYFKYSTASRKSAITCDEITCSQLNSPSNALTHTY